MTEVIVNADDYGLHPDINRGIRYCIEQGLVNSVSVAVCGSAADARELGHLRRLQRATAPRLHVGVHLMLSDGQPLTDCASCQAAPGAFPAYVNGVAWRWLTGRMVTSDVVREWRAQIRQTLDAGFELSHLDSHQHVHLLPQLWECCVGLAEEFGIGRVRSSYQSISSAIWRLHARQAVLQLLAWLRFGRGRSSMKTYGVLQSGELRVDILRGALRRELELGHPLEVMTHPGFESEQLRRAFPDWPASWSAEIEELRLLKQFLGTCP